MKAVRGKDIPEAVHELCFAGVVVVVASIPTATENRVGSDKGPVDVVPNRVQISVDGLHP